MNEETVKIKWNLESITNPEKLEEIKGKWNFSLALDATESSTQFIDQSVEHNGVQVHIGKISLTPCPLLFITIKWFQIWSETHGMV